MGVGTSTYEFKCTLFARMYAQLKAGVFIIQHIIRVHMSRKGINIDEIFFFTLKVPIPGNMWRFWFDSKLASYQLVLAHYVPASVASEVLVEGRQGPPSLTPLLQLSQISGGLEPPSTRLHAFAFLFISTIVFTLFTVLMTTFLASKIWTLILRNDTGLLRGTGPTVLWGYFCVSTTVLKLVRGRAN